MPAANPLPVLSRFGLDGKDAKLQVVSGGYINDTYRVTMKDGRGLILQRINPDVFPKPRQVMENIAMVLPYLQGTAYTALQLEHTASGAPWLETGSGETWRLFHYIPNSVARESTGSPRISREAGRILGTFHSLVLEVPVGDLHTPLPRFHDLDWRARQLEVACSRGLEDRLKQAGPELAAAEKLIARCQEIPFSEFPDRVCHNDTKLSNILFDRDSDRALCLIDLDTLMPGKLLFDFGDAARTLLNPLPESHPARKPIPVDLGMFDAFVQGWQDSGFRMEDKEVRWLTHGVVLMPTLHGIRALADHVSGDLYYQTAFPGQNLVRAQNLLGFANNALELLPALEAILLKRFI